MLVETNLVVEAINQHGFPIIAACAMGYFIYFIWKWVTTVIDPVINDAMVTLIKLVDRVRMLDNDLIRLNQKLAMVLEFKEQLAKKHPDVARDLDKILEDKLLIAQVWIMIVRHLKQFSIKRDREAFVHIFARRELGPLYQQLQEQGNSLEFVVSNAKRLPENYIDVDVYVRFFDEKQCMWFDLVH